MTGLLLRKQLREIFRGWFYDARRGTGRSRASTVGLVVLYFVALLFIMGSVVGTMAATLCAPLAEAGAGWLYFALFGLAAVLFGMLGSAFSTYHGVYIAKDNDLLLSLPIPLRCILTARMLGVYLMSLLYSGLICLPTLLVWWFTVRPGPAAILCGLLWMLLLSLLVLELSCILGWAVARLSQKLKNRSYLTVLFALAFLALYYVFYFRAMDRVRDISASPETYAGMLRSSAYPFYLFGRVAEGDGLALGLLVLALLLLGVLTALLLSRSFLSVVSAERVTERRRSRGGDERPRSVRSALLRRELLRFSSNANYMLNCGLGIVLQVLAGAALLWKGAVVRDAVNNTFQMLPGFGPVLLCAGAVLLGSMNDMATPSTALEGRTLWLLRSLPLEPRQIVQGKLDFQLMLTAPPSLFCGVCIAVAAASNLWEGLLLALLPPAAAVLSACLDTRLGLWHANLGWTSEIVPIKQSLNVLLALFVGPVVAALLLGLYFVLSLLLPAAQCLLILLLLTLLSAWLCFRRLRKKSDALLEAL